MSVRSSHPRYLGLSIGLVCALTVFRLWFCTTFELSGDEAYYWVWSKHLDWSYYSKGPLVAWTIALGTQLFGDTVFGIRFFAVLLGAGTAWFIWLLARRLYSTEVAFWTMVVAGLTPLFTVGGVLMTIDPLSVFFWSAAAYAFWGTRNSSSIVLWSGLGLLIGIGALAKYTNLALIPSLALYLLLTPPLRRHLTRGTFWAMVAAALVCLVPVVIWNYRHDWITISHLLNRGALDRPWRFSAGELLTFLGGQAAVYFPPFFAGLAIGIFTGGPRDAERVDPGAFTYLLCLFAPLFLFYLALAVNSSGEANWTAPAFVGGVILLTATWYHRSRTGRRAAVASRWSLGLAAAFTVAFLAAVNVRLPTERDPFYRIHGWRSLAGQVADAAAEHNATFIIAEDYQTTSLLSFYMDGGYNVFDIRTPGIANQFSFWPSYTESFTGEDAVFVSASGTPHRLLRAQFESVGPPLEIQPLHSGNPVRSFYLYVCRNFIRRGGN